MNIARQRVFGFSMAQALALTFATMSVAMAAIVGEQLCTHPSLSTLPYGAQFAAIIASSYLLSQSMKRYGRRPVFVFAAASVVFAGVTGYLAIEWASFSLNIFAHILLGVGLSGFAYFRFAVTDGLDDALKSRALSLVTLGGVAAAFLGPYIVAKTRNLTENAFSASYFVMSIIAVMLIAILVLIPENKNPSVFSTESQDKATADSGKSNAERFPLRRLLAAIYASGFGYMLMGMLMMQSSLLMSKSGIPFEKSTLVIQLHVAAMFLPSLFMGKIISAIGAERVILSGYFVMLVSIVIAIQNQSYAFILLALIGIGLGWNMLYVGGSSMVAVLPGDASKMQGINESAVAVLQTVGAFSAGVLFAQIGWVNSNWVAMVMLIPGIILILSCRTIHVQPETA